MSNSFRQRLPRLHWLVKTAVALLLCSSFSAAQVFCKYDIAVTTSSSVIGSVVQPVPGAQVWVCPSGSIGQPCTPLTPLFDISGNAIKNPVTADSKGNYSFCVTTANRYMIQVGGTSFFTLTQDNVIIPNDPQNPVFNNLTVTGAFSLTTLALPEIATPPGITGKSVLFADNATHRFSVIQNNGAADKVLTDSVTATVQNKTIDVVTNSITSGGSVPIGRYLKGNGASFTMSAGLASGTGSCTNQVVTATNSDAGPTCASVTSAMTSGTFTATAHNLLSAIHGDTTTASAVRGDIIAAVGVTPTWQRVAHGAATGSYPKWNGTDIIPSTLAASGTGSCAANTFETADNADAAPTCTQPSAANLTNGTTGSGLVVLATSPTVTGPTISSGGLTITETTAPASGIGKTVVYADSTTHRMTLLQNAGAADPVLTDSVTATVQNKTISATNNSISALSFTSTNFAANQGSTTTLLHGNAAGQASFAGVSLTADAAANQGQGSQVLHGNIAGQPSWAAVSSADLNITPTSCTNQFITSIGSSGVAVCTTDTLASAQHANQGTTTTVLHGNAAGNPSFGAVSLTADVSGVLPTANGGTGQNSTATFPTSGVVVTEAATETLTNKRVTPRVVTMADAVSVTPTSDTADVNIFTSSQVAGTLTVNAPTGTPTDGQKLILRLKSTNAQNYSFNATYAFSTTVTAPVTLAAGKTDYIGLIWNATNTKWDVVAVDQGH